MSHHLRIAAAGWETYTGNFGGADFKDGVSVDPLNRKHIDHLCALVRCDLVDADGNAEGQGGISARLVGGVNVGDEPSSLRKITQEELDADRQQRFAENGKSPAQIYSKEELEIIAQKEGIVGLRKIGDKWSVRDRSINKLVLLILQAQRAFTVKMDEKTKLVLASREQAKADALAKLAAREADIDARSKLVVAGGTSNAIGPNGENVTIAPALSAEELLKQAVNAAKAAK